MGPFIKQSCIIEYVRHPCGTKKAHRCIDGAH